MKKIYFLFIIMIMLLTISITVSVNAETTTDTSSDIVQGVGGENVTWTYDKNKKELVIDGYGDMYLPWSKRLDSYDMYLHEVKTIIIGENIDAVRTYQFSVFDTDDPIVVKIKGSLENFDSYSLPADVIIKLYGSAENIGKASKGSKVYKVKKSKNNNQVVIKNRMVLSADEKELYLFYGNKKKVIIPDTVTTIKEMAFHTVINELILGDNVETIEDCAMKDLGDVHTVKFNKKLKYIGEESFANTSLTEINLPKNLTVGMLAFNDVKLKRVKVGKNNTIGIRAFSTKTLIVPRTKFKYAQTSVGVAFYDNYYDNEYQIELNWSKVKGADGYEISLTQNDYKMQWTQKRNEKAIKMDNFIIDDDLYYYGNFQSYRIEVSEEAKNPIYVQVRAYKIKKNGKKVYTRWSVNQIVEHIDRD